MLTEGVFGEHHPERSANCKRFSSKLESSSSDMSFLFPSSNLQSLSFNSLWAIFLFVQWLGVSRLFFPSLTLTVPEVSLWSGGVPGLWQQLDNLRSTRCCLESSETPAVKGELFANTQDKALVSGQTDWEAAHLSYLCFLLWGTHPPTGEEGLKKGSISIKSTWPKKPIVTQNA